MNCNVIRDLLPLYAEDMVSPESKALVEDHLQDCESCTKELENLKNTPKLPLEVETGSLRRVENAIQKRRTLTALAAVMTVIALIVTVYIFMNTTIYLTADQAVEGVELREGGGLAIDFADGTNGFLSSSTNREKNIFFLSSTTRYTMLLCRKSAPKLSEMSPETLERYIRSRSWSDETAQETLDRIRKIYVLYGQWETSEGYVYPDGFIDGQKAHPDGKWIDSAAEKDVWYLNPYAPNSSTLLWNGTGMDYTPSNPWESGLYIGLVLVSALLAAAFALAAWKRPEAVWGILAICAVSVTAATLLVTNGALLIQGSYSWPGLIAAEAAVLSLTGSAWLQLRRCGKK